MKFKLPLLLLLMGIGFAKAQNSFEQQKPKLVIGIVVDQMRYEYLTRFYNHYGDEGFKKIINEGFTANNGHFNYTPTYTGPGHASVFTGSTPSTHGIISNEWYDKNLEEGVNCVLDTAMALIGETGGNGKVSPHRLLVSTLADELKFFTQSKSKSIGISIKDRGAVLPVGRTADAAYWYNKSTGGFNSSTYYFKDQLPAWVRAFNNRKLANQYLTSTWETLKPIDTYIESDPDDSRYETKMPTKRTSTFPYDLAAMKSKTNMGYSLLTVTPYANTIVTEMAKAAIEGEKLGQDGITDILTISYSATDAAGHAFGPYAKEVQDFYLRLDLEIAGLLKHLDTTVGEGQYTVFLTADHAVLDVPQRLIDHKMAGGYFSKTGLSDKINAHLVRYFGKGVYVESISNNQVFLDKEFINSKKIDLYAVQNKVAQLLMGEPGIAEAYPSWMVMQTDFNAGGPIGNLVRGYHHKRSGDILYYFQAGWMSGKGPIGTTHGSGYNYDTHVPILLYGAGIRAGESHERYNITDIAPTITTLLKIPFPSGCTGQPIKEALKH